MKKASLQGREVVLICVATGGLLGSIAVSLWSPSADQVEAPSSKQIANLPPVTIPGPGSSRSTPAAIAPQRDFPADPPKPADKPAKKPEKPVAPATPAPASVPIAWQRPTIPRHYPHIRIAMLAYAGNPMGPVEDRLLRESVDLVVPNEAYLRHIHDVAPETPQLLYTNTSNLYLDLFTDWLTFADSQGLSREAAFYHAARPIAFRGDSPSSQPVTWFWGVYRGGPPFTNLTTAARGKTGKGVPFMSGSESLYLGYPERFREINLSLLSGARGSWQAVLEYTTATDEHGKPTAWAALRTLTDTSAGLTRSGQITFDPPADWKTASVDHSARLFYVRWRTTSTGMPPIASSILGRDYVGANGTTAGTIPVFDTAADANNDGYLDDAEYAKHAPGKEARFAYESRMFTESYGQMRFITNVSNTAFHSWCVAHNRRSLADHPLAAGLFMDNSGGKPSVKSSDVLEPVATYSQDFGVMLHAVAEAVAPKLLFENTVGGYAFAEPIIQQSPAYFEEFAIRPTSHSWSAFEDLAAMIARRTTLTNPPPYAVLDSHPQKSQMSEPRVQIGALAYYYVLADPEATFLMFAGGHEPSTTWARHWSPAAAYDIGQPAGKWSQWTTGPDPAKAERSYRIYQREYTKALVLFKPLSHVRGTREAASIGDETMTRHELAGSYRPLLADGTLGEAVTAITLRNGEGAILIKSKP